MGWRSLEGAKNVIFDAAGITAKISGITEVAEKITGPRAGVDLVAQVARGKKATARLEVTAAKDVEPGIHRFRIQTLLGTSNMAVTEGVFVDAARHDYRLAAGAAAIDAGVSLSAVTVDRQGVPRPVGVAYDIGAYEWQPR